MYDTKAKAFSKESNFYKFLLFFYPKQYRKRFGEEMLFAFDHMYQEELAKHGSIGIGFWFSIVSDTIQSSITEHFSMIKKQGIKKYFNINTYNIIGGILLLPFLILFGIDLLGRIVQGDLTHYNRDFYSVLSQTILYSTYNGQAQLLWTILVFFPLLAVILNLIPLVLSLKQSKNKLTIGSLLSANPLALLIIGTGFLFVLIAFGHDIIPCTVHGIFQYGIFQLFPLIDYCILHS